MKFIGYLAFSMSSLLLFLFAMNLRSRAYYRGPNYGFLFWISLYFAVLGTGVVRCKKWGLILLFVPAVLDGAILLISLGTMRHALLAALANIAIFGLLAAVPALLLRQWKELHW
jgi:hypothetical protein